MKEYAVKLKWDEDAAVWAAVNYEIPIAMDDASLDALIQKVRSAAAEILQINGKEYENIYLKFSVKHRAKVYA